MEFFHKLINLIFFKLGDNAAWNDLIHYVGQPTLYAVMFAIIFCETGLVILPFLPGDSLLFALGALGARGDIHINLPVMAGLMIVAAILGDAVNYWIGHKLGPAVLKREDSRLLNKKHLAKAHEFYEKYGGKTIILARFVPIVRTFAPFVAGVGKMNYFRFAAYNVIGGIAWVLICIGAGRLFGEVAFVKKHFELVILAVIAISIVPMALEWYRAHRAGKRASAAAAQAVGIQPPAVTPAARDAFKAGE